MRILIIAIISFFSLTLSSQSTLDIMYYNLLNFPGTTHGRTDTLRKTVQYILPDLLVVNELSSEEGADIILDNSLNVWGINYYKRAEFTDGPDTDNMLFYDSTKVALYSQFEIETELRLINEYVLYTLPIITDTVFMYVYSAHLKASDGSSEANLRYREMVAFKEHLTTLNDSINIIFGGDLNIYRSSEKAYDEIIEGQDIYLYDPIFSPGNWHNNESYADIHTQSTRTSQFGGGAKGGMDDRFDMIFVSDVVLNGAKRIKYVEDSYYALGQDGQRFNKSLINPTNTSAPDSVISALYYMSDHLPVIMSIDVLEQANAISELHSNILDIQYKIQGSSIHFVNIEDPIIFKVFDILGQLVFSLKINHGSQSIQLPNKLKTGIYIFRFEGLQLEKTLTQKQYLPLR